MRAASHLGIALRGALLGRERREHLLHVRPDVAQRHVEHQREPGGPEVLKN